MIPVVRVSGWPDVGGRIRRAIGPFVHIGLSEDDSPGSAQVRDNGCVLEGLVTVVMIRKI